MARQLSDIAIEIDAVQVSRRTLLIGGGTVGVAAVGGVFALQNGDPGTPDWMPGVGATETPGEATPASPAADKPSPPAPTQAVEPIDPADILAETSVTDLRTMLDDGAFTIGELVTACLDRIKSMDRGTLRLNAVIETNPDAMDIAEDLDRELADGKLRSPLHGIPILLKDVVATGDAMRTTAGSLAMEDNTVSKDAFLAARLRDAGAVILGKSNMTEWSNFMGSSGVSGFSARGGQAVNPYHLDYSPSGSSSGSAIAVAAGYVPLAIGAETNGSIIAPAASCGVIGMKPTVGLVSRAGVIGISFTQDSLGPIGRSVTDVAHMLNAIVGFDEDDPAVRVAEDILPTTAEPPAQSIDYTAELDTNGLDGVRVGVCRSLFGFDDRADGVVLDILPVIEDAGATIVEDVYVTSMDELLNGYAVLLTEFSWGLSEYLETYATDGPIGSIQDIVDFNLEHANLELSVTDQSGLTDALVAAAIDDRSYLDTRAINLELARQRGIDAVMDELNLDVLIAPAASIPPPIGGGEGAIFGSSAQLPSIAGYPSITVPIGLYTGLPVGLHLFGRAFSEQSLLNYAYALEQALPPRSAPEYIRRGDPLPEE